jgi:GTP-binding protein
MLVCDLAYSDYVGRLAVGRIVHGSVSARDQLVCVGREGTAIPLRVTQLQVYQGPRLIAVESAGPGDIVVMAGVDAVTIGDTICTRENPGVLPRIRVDDPTVSMRFTINTSPLAGREGSIVQSRRIRERLLRESLSNVAVQVEANDGDESFLVKGRGEFQMSILVETMRREGFELGVGRPEVILREVGGRAHEPVERVQVDCDEIFMGVVTEKLSLRKGRMLNCANNGNGRVRLEFSVPSRGMIGYRDEFLTDTRGSGVMTSLFSGYEPWRGDFPTRFTGSIVADRAGAAVPYALFNLEPRGELFVVPGDPVYEGMIVGEHNRESDIDVNPTKEKKLTNMRAAGHDENVILTPVRPMTLERALHFVREDEMVEITPLSIRLRKVELDARRRYQAGARKK